MSGHDRKTLSLFQYSGARLDALQLVEQEHDRLGGDLVGLLCAPLADRKPLANRDIRQRSGLFPLMRVVFSPGELELMGGEMQLFLYANRRVATGSTATARALLEAVRALLASSVRPTVQQRRYRE